MKGGGEKGPFCDSSLSIRKWTQKMRFIREKLTIFHFFFLQVSWYKDGRSVHFDGNHVSEQHGSLFMLRLKQITINDLGNYTCEAENSQGLARDHIELSGNVYRRTDFRKAKHGWYLFLRDSFIIVYKNFFSRLDFFFSFTKCHAYLEDFAKKCLSSSFSNQSPDSGDGLFQSN